jgi:hypothetical protein
MGCARAYRARVGFIQEKSIEVRKEVSQETFDSTRGSALLLAFNSLIRNRFEGC